MVLVSKKSCRIARAAQSSQVYCAVPWLQTSSLFECQLLEQVPRGLWSPFEYTNSMGTPYPPLSLELLVRKQRRSRFKEVLGRFALPVYKLCTYTKKIRCTEATTVELNIRPACLEQHISMTRTFETRLGSCQGPLVHGHTWTLGGLPSVSRPLVYGRFHPPADHVGQM